jgi:pantoate--beta-alanine ligase
MQKLALGWKRAGRRIGFVPTMGYLHAGHISLVEKARQKVGPDGIVVVSIYVNPTQFSPQEDLAKYPRDLKRDQKLCRAAGTDLIFAPASDQMYPPVGQVPYSTYVAEEFLSQVMEGKARPVHFRGVTTVVAKLFNIVLPDVAVFGAKDYQQAAIISKMARDLNFPVQVIVAPTLREPDGLAMSSRNKYLSPSERFQALSLSQALQQARAAVLKSPAGIPVERLRKRLLADFAKHPAACVDYIEFFEPETLQPARIIRKGVHMAMAVYIGKTRLIDNGTLG